jgi:phosphopantothenoylcysteine decarboxylase/phosphopantothenate--cysteine ligase
MMLSGKNIVLGVTGSIAAYKMANLASMLVKQGANVDVIMTRNACEFISPLTFETLTSRKCLVDTFDRQVNYSVEHVSLAAKADLLLVAPATADAIGKLAHGICDDMLTTTFMTCQCPKLVAPAMNTRMWTNAILQDNVSTLQRYGIDIITPDAGRLACGEVGSGKLPSEELLLQHILTHIALPHDMRGKRVLITAGPTYEAIDPVRFITNHSTGKMGYALAKMARLRGAEVTLVSGPVALEPFLGIDKVAVKSAADMFETVTKLSPDFDIIIMCSAVADYTPLEYHDQKVKKTAGDLSLPLTRTRDILQYLGEHRREGQYIVGFSMETEHVLDNSEAKLNKKHVDMICANTIGTSHTGFAADTNQVSVITHEGVTALPLCTKEETATGILDAILQHL